MHKLTLSNAHVPSMRQGLEILNPLPFPRARSGSGSVSSKTMLTLQNEPEVTGCRSNQFIWTVEHDALNLNTLPTSRSRESTGRVSC